jgi:hypothetical protein
VDFIHVLGCVLHDQADFYKSGPHRCNDHGLEAVYLDQHPADYYHVGLHHVQASYYHGHQHGYLYLRR